MTNTKTAGKTARDTANRNLNQETIERCWLESNIRGPRVVLVIDTRDSHGKELAKAMGANGSARYLMTCVPAQTLDDEEFKVSLVAKADKVNYAIIAHGTTQVFLPSAGSDD